METIVERVFDNARKRCGDLIVPYYYFNASVLQYFNNITQNFESELPVTLCSAANLYSNIASRSVTQGQISFLIVAAGIISTVLALITLSNKSLNAVTFYYHRVINVADGIYMVFILVDSVSRMLDPGFSSKSWYLALFTTIFADKLETALPDFVEFIVCWIAIERASIHFPTVFARINRKRVAYSIIISTFTLSLCLNLPSVFTYIPSLKPDGSGAYVQFKTNFGASAIYQSYLFFMTAVFAFKAILITIGTAATIMTLIQFSWRKRKLAESAGQESTTNVNLIAQIKLNHYLCILQLCESIPLLVICGLRVAMGDGFVNSKVEYFLPVSFNEASRLIKMYSSLHSLLIAKHVIGRVIHCLHFYLYLMFVPRIRNVAFQSFRFKVNPTGTIFT